MCDREESEFTFGSCSTKLKLDINKDQFNNDAEVEITSEYEISKVCTITCIIPVYSSYCVTINSHFLAAIYDFTTISPWPFGGPHPFFTARLFLL